MSILKIGDTFFALRFLRLLTTPWKKTNAYKHGLIDENGNRIREPETSDERGVYNVFHRLVFNIKKLINKLPLGKTTLASYAAALYLIKEHTGLSEEVSLAIIQEVTCCDDDIVVIFERQEIVSGTYKVNGLAYDLRENEYKSHEDLYVEINENCLYDTIFGIELYRVKDNADNYILITKENIS